MACSWDAPFAVLRPPCGLPAGGGLAPNACRHRGLQGELCTALTETGSGCILTLWHNVRSPSAAAMGSDRAVIRLPLSGRQGGGKALPQLWQQLTSGTAGQQHGARLVFLLRLLSAGGKHSGQPAAPRYTQLPQAVSNLVPCRLPCPTTHPCSPFIIAACTQTSRACVSWRSCSSTRWHGQSRRWLPACSPGGGQTLGWRACRHP